MSDEQPSNGEALLDAFQRVGQGDFITPLPEAKGAALADGFDQMLTQLREHDRELRQASTRIASASDARRRKAERDMHDGVQQHLALIGLKLSILRGLIRDNKSAADELCGELAENLQNALRELRTLAHWIYPAVLENDGLVAALRDDADRVAIDTRLELGSLRRYPREIEAAAYFCCLEALRNAAQHAGTGAGAVIRVAEAQGELAFEVADNGGGFEPDAAADLRSGLQHITDRIDALGGTLEISSAPGHGTRVHGTIPLADLAA
jgi:signal transduction histidine kinase